MKEVALYDAKNQLSALIQEVEETGEDILITRHGKPAARLAPAEVTNARARAEAISRLNKLREDIARRNPNAPQFTWEELKRMARDEEEDAD